MKMCDRCRVPGCLLNYNGKACANARKEYCPDVVYTNADRLREMTDEELQFFLEDIYANGWSDAAADSSDNRVDWESWLKQEAVDDGES